MTRLTRSKNNSKISRVENPIDDEKLISTQDAMNAAWYRAMLEETDLDRLLTIDAWRHLHGEPDHDVVFDALVRQQNADLEAMVADYKRHRAKEEQSQKMRREHAQATRKREAMINDWLGNVGNLDIQHHVRQMARDGGPDVIDFVERRKEMADEEERKKRRRDRLGIL